MSEQRLVGPAINRELSDPADAVRMRGTQLLSMAATFVVSHGLLLTILLTGLLGLWRLDHYPRTWFDEGSYLEVAQNISENGQYFAQAPDGSRDFAPVIAVGPTVLLPAAIAQSTLGTTLLAGRLVGVFYLVLASAALYLATRRFFGARAALLCVGMVLSMPALDWLGTGRQLLGEAAALFFLLLAAALAFRSRNAGGAALAGLALGLAMMTKGQYLLVLPPVIAIVAGFDFLSHRVRPLRWHVVLAGTAFLTYAGWFAVLLSLIGEGSLVENYRLLRDASDGALFVFDLDRMRAAATLLLGPRTLFLIPPSVTTGCYLIYRETNPSRRLALISISAFQICWLGWFALASIAWPRYAFPALAISAIYAAVLASKLMDVVQTWLRDQQPSRRGEAMAAAFSIVAIGLLVLAGAYREIVPVFTADESEPQQFAAAMDETVPSGTTVDGWEPEINFLSEREMQYPPVGSLDRVVRAAWLGSSEEIDLSSSLSADYLVVGHFGRWVGVYETALTSGQYRLIRSQDGFELYERLGAP